MKKTLYYAICILFSLLSIFLLIVSTEQKVIIISLLNLLFFGGGGIAYYILDKKETKNKTIALMYICLLFIISSYAVLPFNHLFDGTWRYTPALGWIVGMAGIIFFGFGFIVSIIRIVKKQKSLPLPQKFQHQ
jgi:peptidoglycan/LPS O-acetylase OafA/YrhL